MNKEEILGILLPALCDIFDAEPDEIGEDTDLREEFGADEYDLTELSMIVEEEFGVEVKKLASCRTVGQIAEAIRKTVGKQ